MKIKSLLLACATACAIATPAMAEGGMFEGVLPEGWTADVVAAVKWNYYNFSNWQQDGTSNYTWLITYDADVQGKWKVANWRNLVNLALGKTWTDGLGQRKSADKIFWESMLDFNMTEVLKPYIGNRSSFRATPTVKTKKATKLRRPSPASWIRHTKRRSPVLPTFRTTCSASVSVLLTV